MSGDHRYSRRNGWAWPPHVLQIIAWIVVLFFGAITPLHLISVIRHEISRIVLYVAFSVIFGATVVINIVVTSLDPADRNVRLRIRNSARPDFDRSAGKVIDENLFCNICQAKISNHAKHCRQCNKCVADFDHHCKWLNNCVGERNYKLFLTYVLMTVITCLGILILALTQIAFYTRQKEYLLISNATISTVLFTLPEESWLGVTILVVVLSGCVAILNSHLFAFHLKLILRGMTTYSFIVQLRQQEKEDHLTSSQGFVGTPSTLSKLKYKFKTVCTDSSKDKENLKDGEVMPAKLDANHLSVQWKPHEQDSTAHVQVTQNQSHQQQQVMPNQVTSSESQCPKPSLPIRLPPLKSPSRSNRVGNDSHSSSNSSLSNLPPIRMPPQRSEKIFDPHVETVFIDGAREMFLPSININPPSDSEDNLVEIPLSSFSKGSSTGTSTSEQTMSNGRSAANMVTSTSGSIDANTSYRAQIQSTIFTPQNPGVYIASGNFQLVKINHKEVAASKLERQTTVDEVGFGYQRPSLNSDGSSLTSTSSQKSRKVRFV